MAISQLGLGWINLATFSACGVALLVVFRDKLDTPWPWALACGLVTIGAVHVFAAYLIRHRLRTQAQASRGARIGLISLGAIGGVLLITGFIGTFLRPVFGW